MSHRGINAGFAAAWAVFALREPDTHSAWFLLDMVLLGWSVARAAQ